MKFTTREGSTAVYGNNFFKIENVILVTSLHDSVSKRKEEQSQEKKEAEGFESIFKQACADEKAKEREISYQANGYTKNGFAYNYLEKRREYI